MIDDQDVERLEGYRTLLEDIEELQKRIWIPSADSARCRRSQAARSGMVIGLS